jgi:hypothetical protein
MASILEKEYKEAERPYSQNELKYMRDLTRKKLRLSNTRAEHGICGHFYYVLKNGRKEKEILESNCSDTGNCSVCWKVNKTRPKRLSESAKDLVYNYCNVFCEEPKFLSYNTVYLETTFYTWLYEEMPEMTKNFKEKEKEKDTKN